MNAPIDLRSDTVTKPSEAMRKAMAQAEVGDDVYREDPTLNRLQEQAAELYGKEAGLFVPSGTMGNQIAIKVHTQPGQEIIGDADCHIFNFEMAAASQYAGVMSRMVFTERGFLSEQNIEDAYKPGDDHTASTGLVVVENTHNMKGGGVYPAEQLQTVVTDIHQRNLPIHMDGARSLNAAVASEVSPARLTQEIDSVMFCFSKGLGAPVGSMLLGTRNFIEVAYLERKRLGGGMRQAGILAAACLYALDHHIERLADDHTHAQRLGNTLNELGMEVDPVETNIVFFNTPPRIDAQGLVKQLEQHGVLCFALGPSRVRMVTHLDVSTAQIETTCQMLKKIIGT